MDETSSEAGSSLDDSGSMPLDLMLVRHGHSEGNAALNAAKSGDGSLMSPEYRERAVSDYRLTAEGRRQAEATGRFIRSWMDEHAPEGFDRWYCSPFVRTRETAALLDLPDASWQLESLLRERDFGLWAGRSRLETNEEFPLSSEQKRRNKFLWRPECGESTPDLDLRVREVLATLAREQAGRRVMCVTHEDVMWAFRYRLEKISIDEWLRHQDDDGGIPNCAVLHYTRIDADGDTADKFARVRVVDTSDPDGADADSAAWTDITRPRFSNADLLGQVSMIPHLWAEEGPEDA